MQLDLSKIATQVNKHIMKHKNKVKLTSVWLLNLLYTPNDHQIIQHNTNAIVTYAEKSFSKRWADTSQDTVPIIDMKEYRQITKGWTLEERRLFVQKLKAHRVVEQKNITTQLRQNPVDTVSIDDALDILVDQNVSSASETDVQVKSQEQITINGDTLMSPSSSTSLDHNLNQSVYDNIDDKNEYDDQSHSLYDQKKSPDTLKIRIKKIF